MNCIACNYDPSAIITGTYTLVLNASAQSLNSVGVNNKNNRGYRTARRRWERLLKPYEKLPLATNKRRVFFTRFWGRAKRPYDYGNLVGGFKPLLDMLVKCGLLVDDRPTFCEEYYRQFKSPDGQDCVILIIEDYENT